LGYLPIQMNLFPYWQNFINMLQFKLSWVLPLQILLWLRKEVIFRRLITFNTTFQIKNIFYHYTYIALTLTLKYLFSKDLTHNSHLIIYFNYFCFFLSSVNFDSVVVTMEKPLKMCMPCSWQDVTCSVGRVIIFIKGQIYCDMRVES